jgi:hypothetical protein
MRTEPPTGDELAGLLVSMKRNVLDQVANERPAPKRPQLSDRVIGVVVAVTLLLGLGTGAALAFGIVPPPLAPQIETNATPTTTSQPRAEFPIATAAPNPTPSADPLLSVTTIVVRPERLDLQDAAGAVVRELSYDDDTAHFVQTLTTVLGAEPAVEDALAGSDVVARTYTWPGLVVSDDLVDAAGHPDMNLTVRFDQSTLGDGVDVSTVTSFVPGGDLAAFAASVGKAYDPGGYAENLISLETGPALGPTMVDGYVNAHAVAASDWGEASTGPSVVFAPFNFGHEQGTADATG